MNGKNPKVDLLIKPDSGRMNIKNLSDLVIDCQLTEELKWGNPCYTFEDSNIALTHGFKEYCTLLFMKGLLIKDPIGILIQQTENVQSARQIRFTTLEEIEEMEPILKSYINKAIEVEKSGLEVEYKITSEFTMPEELQIKLDGNPAKKEAFEALTPGRQRGYKLYFSGAKQSKTREARVEKYIPQILNCKGLND